jgi:hypothetical protein
MLDKDSQTVKVEMLDALLDISFQHLGPNLLVIFTRG